MNKIKQDFSIAVMLVLLISCIAFSQDYWQKRLSDSKIPIAETGSYTYIVKVNVSSANWTVPDSVIILAMCVDTAGAVIVSTSTNDSIRLYMPDYFCYPVRITKFFKVGTDSLLRSGKITAYGHKKKI